MFSDNVAVFRCACRSKESDCDGKAWRQGTVFHCEVRDECHPGWRPLCFTGWGRLDDPNCNDLDDKEVVRIVTPQLETTCSETKGEYTPCRSQMDWGRASETKDSCGKIHFTKCFRSVEGTSMFAGMILIEIGRHQRSEWHLRTMVPWTATQHWCGFSDFAIAERHISANACQCTCGVSRTWRRWSIKWATPGLTWQM